MCARDDNPHSFAWWCGNEKKIEKNFPSTVSSWKVKQLWRQGEKKNGRKISAAWTFSDESADKTQHNYFLIFKFPLVVWQMCHIHAAQQLKLARVSGDGKVWHCQQLRPVETVIQMGSENVLFNCGWDWMWMVGLKAFKVKKFWMFVVIHLNTICMNFICWKMNNLANVIKITFHSEFFKHNLKKITISVFPFETFD